MLDRTPARGVLAALATTIACGHSHFTVVSDGPIDGAVDAPPSYRETVLADQPLSYWRFGETTGTYAHDEVGSAEPGTFANATLGQPGAIDDGNLAIEVMAVIGGDVEVADVYGFEGVVPFSLEIWAKPTSFVAVAGNILFSKSSPSDGITLTLGSNGGPSFTRCASAACDAASSTPVTLLAWNHVVATFDGTKMQLYVNGGIVAQTVPTPPVSLDGAPGLVFKVGCFSAGGSCFDGVLDEAAVYDHALAPDRILAHCNAAHNPDITCMP